MRFWIIFLKVTLIRTFIFSITLFLGIAVFYLNKPVNQKNETYILKIELFNLKKADCSRPNPLILLVNVNKNQEISLNFEKFGYLSDTTHLEEKISDVFRQRTDEGVTRYGTNEVERKVVVRFDKSIEYSKVIKLIDTLNRLDASPIVLDIDNNYNYCYPLGAA